jgi:pyruvate ferredoxin oxidoreductase gamma subunit
MYEIRIHSRGGQGGVTAARLLADAAFRDGKYATASPFYGAERRGAPVVSFVRIDDRPIRIYSQIEHPDLVIVLDPSVMDAIDVLQGLKSEGAVFINSSHTLEITGHPVYQADLTAIAIGHKLVIAGSPVLNTPLMGALARIGIVTLESAIHAIQDMFSDERNIIAARAAYEELHQ